jgi:hypothetical protein
MTRMGMMLAAVAVGGVLLTAGDARACACKGQESACKKAVEQAQAPKDTQAEQQASPEATAPVASEELHAAKCQCGSAADCTCKKGTCQCAKCQKPKRQVVEPLQGQTQAPRLHKARYDASAGLFL